ncbi:hypothetical protein [Lactiplantibacillus plantarum]|uniref:hypothetical protein n=1 Tax=Lactiplantibacillus plantarum TaxID=1590 RepID=UPI000934BD57|nr:hypothetical protein [Lactiplantibacillus plantarum]
MAKEKFILPLKKDKPALSSLKENYAGWRMCMKDANSNFYILSNSLKKYLPVLKTGALNLYLFYCFSANNKSGENWFSIDTIAQKLETTTRSVSNWNNDLMEIGLISRGDEHKSSKTTFLLPISNFFVNYSEAMSFKEYLENYDRDIDGELYSVYHIFQWRKGEKEKKYDKPQNYIVLTFNRIYTKENHNFSIKKFCLFTSKDINKFKLDSFKVFDKIYLFDSPFDKDLDGIHVKGIVVSSKFDFIGDSDETLNILNELSANDKKLTKENFKKRSGNIE